MSDKRSMMRLKPLSMAIGLVVMASTTAALAKDFVAKRDTPYTLALQQRAQSERGGTRVIATKRLRGGVTHAVTSCADDGSAGTLRAILGQAAAGDTVDLSGLTCSVITLTQGELDVGAFGDNPLLQVDLIGPGRDQLAIDGNNASPVLAKFHLGGEAAQGILRVSDLTIRNGRYTGGMASCVNTNGLLELTRVDISGCVTTGGGPQFASAVNTRTLVMVDSTVTGSSGSTTGTGDSRVVLGTVYASTAEIIDSTISGNTITSQSGGSGLYYTTAGAGVYVRGNVSISGSTISGNSGNTTAAGHQGAVGGGLFATGDVVIIDSTIDGNTVNGTGGGVFKAPFSPWGDPPGPGTSLHIANSTISGNQATFGGGISSARPTLLTNTTIAFNQARQGGGGLVFDRALIDTVQFEFQSVILAANNGLGAVDTEGFGADLASTGTLTVVGQNNLVVDSAGIALPAGTIRLDPRLLPLANNGGATRTHALMAESPAIDAGNNIAGEEYDQRGAGFPRVVGTSADIGAVEHAGETTVVEYAYDDGDGDTNQGPPSTFDPDMLWGNYYLTEPGGEIITEISVAFGPTFPSLKNGPVTFWLLDDPDMDFDPRNATSLVSVTGTPTMFNDNFFTVQIPPTQVSGAFFVGASAKLRGGQDRPARVDTNASGDMSWFFYAPEIADVIDDLASAPFGSRMDNPQYVIYPGAFMIRATGTSVD